jgi:hypothetical protein
MRWLLPLVLVVVLAVCAADTPPARKPKLPRAVLAGPVWHHVAVAASDRAGSRDQGIIVPAVSPAGATVADDPQAAILQSAAFDAATGTLTWFDNEDYN